MRSLIPRATRKLFCVALLCALAVLLFSSTAEGGEHIYVTVKGKQVQTLRLAGQSVAYVNRTHYSTGLADVRLASAYDGGVKMWDVNKPAVPTLMWTMADAAGEAAITRNIAWFSRASKVDFQSATMTPTRTVPPPVPTRTRTFTPTGTPTITATPTVTPTWPVACETPVFKGNDLIRVRVQYAHEATPGVPHEVRLGPIHFENDGDAIIRAEGHPSGCDWRFTSIFSDGFESGGAGAWSGVGP